MSQTIDAIEDEVVLLDESGIAHRPGAEERRARTRHRAAPGLLVPRAQRARRGARHAAMRSRKQSWPGVWSNSFCGHPRPAESLRAAVRRRAEFELGIELTEVELAPPAVPVPGHRRERHRRERGVPGVHRRPPRTSPTPTRARSPSTHGSHPRTLGRAVDGGALGVQPVAGPAGAGVGAVPCLTRRLRDRRRAARRSSPTPACRAGEFGAHYAALWESLEQQSSGGKRIRPRLVNAAYAGLGGTDPALATRVARRLRTAAHRVPHPRRRDRPRHRAARGAEHRGALRGPCPRARRRRPRQRGLGRDGRRARRRPRPEPGAPRDRDPARSRPSAAPSCSTSSTAPCSSPRRASSPTSSTPARPSRPRSAGCSRRSSRRPPCTPSSAR